MAMELNVQEEISLLINDKIIASCATNITNSLALHVSQMLQTTKLNVKKLLS